MQKHDVVPSKDDSFQEEKMQMNLLVVSQQDAAGAWFTITPQAYTLRQYRKRPCGCLGFESV